MNPAALFLSGWLAGILTAVFLTILALRASGDRADDLSADDPHGDVTIPPGFRFVGSADQSIHVERN